MAIQCTTQALLAGPRVLSHHNTLQYAGSLVLEDHKLQTQSMFMEWVDIRNVIKS